MHIRKLTFTAGAIALTLSLLIPTSVFAQTLPTVTTEFATNITTTSASLNGNLRDLGTATRVIVSFEYRTTTSHWSTTTPIHVTGSTGAFEESLIGLSLGTTYHFRAKAQTGEGITKGSVMSFTTLTPLMK